MEKVKVLWQSFFCTWLVFHHVSVCVGHYASCLNIENNEVLVAARYYRTTGYLNIFQHLLLDV